MIPLERGYKVGDISIVGVFEQYDKTKTFNNEREFVFCIYGAKNAFGLIGPEENGIAILDKNNKTVVLDNHIKETTGYFGPSQKQIQELERIMEMEWTEFKQFVNDHPRSRIKIVSQNKIEYNYQV